MLCLMNSNQQQLSETLAVKLQHHLISATNSRSGSPDSGRAQAIFASVSQLVHSSLSISSTAKSVAKVKLT